MIQREKDELFSVYPNPSNGSFHVKLKHTQTQSLQLSLYDVAGKLVFMDNLNSDNESMDYHYEKPLEGGIYYIKIDGAAKPFHYKLSVIK